MMNGTLTITLHLGEDGIRVAGDVVGVLEDLAQGIRDGTSPVTGCLSDSMPAKAGGIVRDYNTTIVGEWQIERDHRI